MGIRWGRLTKITHESPTPCFASTPPELPKTPAAPWRWRSSPSSPAMLWYHPQLQWDPKNCHCEEEDELPNVVCLEFSGGYSEKENNLLKCVWSLRKTHQLELNFATPAPATESRNISGSFPIPPLYGTPTNNASESSKNDSRSFVATPPQQTNVF